MNFMLQTHRQVIDTQDAEYWQDFCTRWPYRNRNRIITDAEIVEQGHRVELKKALLWQEEITCEKCTKRLAINTERYCKHCRREVIKELENCGYLQMLGDTHCGMRRTEEMKELTHETKHGTRSGQGH